VTLEELLDCSADKLAAMSDAELEAHFAPMLNITRPELVAKEQANSGIMRPSRKQDISQTDEYKRKAAMLAERFGVKLPGF